MPDTSTGGTNNLAESGGRLTRRDRNRDVVVDCLLDLYGEGNLAPTVAEVAERSGVSHRSVFRYFEDMDELDRAAVDRQSDRVSHLFEIPDLGRGSFETRVAAIVDQRLQLYEQIAPTARVARLRAPFQPVIAASLSESRRFMRAQVEAQFEPELATRPAPEAEAVLAAADVLLSFESVELLLHGHSQATPNVAGVLRSGLVALLLD